MPPPSLLARNPSGSELHFTIPNQLPKRFGCSLLYPCSCAQSVSGIAARSSTTGTAWPSLVRSIVRTKNLHVSQASTRICGNCSATYTGSFFSSSSPQVGQRMRRNSHSYPQKEQTKQRFPPSPSIRSTPNSALPPHNGHKRGVASTGGSAIRPATYAA